MDLIFCGDKYRAGSKLFTSPPRWVENSLVSKLVIVLMPDVPEIRAFQKSSLPNPIEEMTPIPLMTTLFAIS
jgi:hypothetical protein